MAVGGHRGFGPGRGCAPGGWLRRGRGVVRWVGRGSAGLVGRGVEQGADGADDLGLGGFGVGAEGGEGAASGEVLVFEEGEEEVFGADVVVAEAQGDAEGEFEGFAGGGVVGDEVGEGIGGRLFAGGDGGAQGLGGDALSGEEVGGDGVGVGEEAEGEVAGADVGLAGGAGGFLGGDDGVAGAGVKRLKPSLGSRSPLPLGTNRFWAACLVTPSPVPISVQEAPERRAWSTKWPMRWSATSPRCSATTTAPESRSRGSVWLLLMASMRSSRRADCGGLLNSDMRQP